MNGREVEAMNGLRMSAAERRELAATNKASLW